MATRFGSIEAGIILFLLLTVPVPSLRGQEDGERRAWAVTAMGGLVDYDFADDDFPIFALRADRPVSRWFRLEFETSLARTDVQTDEEGVFDPTLPEENSSLGTVSLGVQARLPMERVEPYVGLAAGLVWRRDDDADGLRNSQATFAFPAGVRLFITDRIGLRAEFRVRRDQTVLGVPDETNFERTLGISWTF